MTRSAPNGLSGVKTWLVLSKATAAISRHVERHVDSLGLCPTDFAVLEALLHRGPLQVNVIGRKVLLSSGSITTAVDRLERRGLVTRRPDPGDRRARLVDLTPGGRALIEPGFVAHQAVLERATAGLSPAERRELARLLLKLGRAAEDSFHRDEAPEGDRQTNDPPRSTT